MVATTIYQYQEWTDFYQARARSLNEINTGNDRRCDSMCLAKRRGAMEAETFQERFVKAGINDAMQPQKVNRGGKGEGG